MRGNGVYRKSCVTTENNYRNRERKAWIDLTLRGGREIEKKKQRQEGRMVDDHS